MRLILLAILIVLTSSQSRYSSLDSWVIEKNSTLAIDGSSNINQFTCDIVEYVKADTLRAILEQGKSRYSFTSNSDLTVEIRRFDCHHKYITSDFRKMLKSDQYPCLVIRFLSLDEFRNGMVVKGQVMVELAGKKKIMDVSYSCVQSAPDQIRLRGVRVMKFSDFDLEPPRKVGGLIRINEEIKVNFNLNFRKLHS